MNATEAAAPLVLLEDRGTYAILRLNRPDKRNAMNRSARRDLMSALSEAARRKFKVVVLTGTGSAFCSGVDLKEHASDIEDCVGADPTSDWLEVNVAIREHPAIFIAAVNGVAMGGGVTLIGVCDLAIASEDAQISNPEMGFGAFPQLAGPAVQFNITAKRAAWLVLTTERVSGSTAAHWGLVNESVVASQLMSRAEEIAAQIARFDAVSLAQSKRAIDGLPGSTRPWREAFIHGMTTNEVIRAQRLANGNGRQEKK
jgi:enoyl-CoA hydratase/carnithine racemase